MSNVGAVSQQHRVVPARNVQLVGGNVGDADLLLSFARLDLDLRKGLGRDHAVLRGFGQHLRRGLGLLLGEDFRLRVACQKRCKLNLGDVAVSREDWNLNVFVVPLHAARLHQQRIFCRCVEDQKAVVLLVENMIASVGRLLGAGLIFRPDRIENHGLVGAGEHFNEVGQHALHGVENV